ncbi:capsular biosynthesis protein [Alistipes sp. An54]|nr:capsular biosynthesis protein [Alistipes sp. An54]
MRLWFGGDVMQHLPQVEAARSGTGFDYGPVFAALAPRMQAADLAVVNLETTLTRTARYTGYPLFRSPVALADALREAGVDVAVMANNHCCDGGADGIRTGIEELDRCGIRHTGVFVDSVDYRQNNPLYLTRHGIRIALVNYTYGTNGMPVPQGMIVNRIDTLQMARDLAAARRRGVDLIVACLHWGVEYERQANASQRQLAAFLRRQGVAVVVGSHPHVVQPWEADSSHVVLYSLGNLVSNQRRRYTDGGLVAEVEAVRHPDGRMTCRLETTPVWVALPRYRILPPEAADTMSLPAAYGLFRADVEALTASGSGYKRSK